MSTPPAVLRDGLRWAAGVAGPAEPCGLSAEDRAAVTAAGLEYIAAWRANDPVRVARLLADDVVMIPHHGGTPRSGKQAVLDWWFPGGEVTAPIVAYDLDATEVGGCGDLAWDRGRMHEVSFEWNGRRFTNRNGNYLTLYRRDAGEWRIMRRIWNDPLPQAL